ncbi:GNAT family N-acetyltransferase [Paenibacillus sp. CAA11]|uniref:GNAT family N-acetyltransferase n=1 Tax=Paenibacillus sp. CAA11 TaxID=1532905 RepID=UPI000D34A518|nr:GNAT family N-acetyltransferase [Paenibacillus sp. CAA11]AWB43922.1 GNAT family N-acetyltransferase [Paenibacillus sp. CAA11]
MIRYRRPKQDDPVIYNLIEEELVPYSQLSPSELSVIRQELPERLKRGVTLVASPDYESDPLAFVHFIMHGDLLYIDMLAVTRRQQHRRYGKTLMAHAESFALSRGAKRARVMVDGGNPRAHLFYNRLGYVTIRFIPKSGCYEMEKQLMPL